MSVFKCPYCGIPLSTTNNLHTSNIMDGIYFNDRDIKNSHPSHFLHIEEYFCPECSNRTVIVNGYGEQYDKIHTTLLPDSLAKQYPDYIPQPIRQDYEEAYKILHLSPKASATLSRRCLQGMIHDFWNIKGRNLNCEISSLKDKISPLEWKVLDSHRKLGNIGAHMEKDINTIVDIDEHEAENLLKLIEYLLKNWYIKDYETKQLFTDITEIAKIKETQRTSKS